MARMTWELAVEMEDGATWVVVADQRDAAKWEVQPFGCPIKDIKARLFTALRFLAWSASTRQGRTELSWAEWDAACVEVGDPDEPEGEEGSADPLASPGQPGPSGEDSSTSPL